MSAPPAVDTAHRSARTDSAVPIEYRTQEFDLAFELDQVRSIVLGELEGAVEEVRSPLAALAGSRAKLLRPTFVLLAAAFGRYDREKMTNIAAAIELFHMASLVHDDIVDGAGTRRGRPAVHVSEGEKQAVLMGDWLFSRSFALVSAFAEVDNLRRLAGVVGTICESEILETASRRSIDRSVRRYLRRIAGKTAALFALSCFVGAKEAGCGEAICERMRRTGYHIGMGFQIIDDILDLDSSEASIGKPTGTDLREGIITLPVVHALKNDDGRLEHALRRPARTAARVARIIRLTLSLGGIAKARTTAKQYTDRALREIARLPAGFARDELDAIARRLLVREY